MAGRSEDAPTPSTRDALMDAALDLLTERGVLAGLNLREVADRVGVTPANIYHLFGSRQGLLRAALTRELAQMRTALAEAGPLPFVARRVRMFDVIGSRPRLALTALLALDDDPDYKPLPFIEATRAQYQGGDRCGRAAGRHRHRRRARVQPRDFDRGRDLRRLRRTPARRSDR